jgi:GrpB-like predicted nucleotidyltransferase (UPF0157 family)
MAKYVFKPYSEKFPELFEREKKRLSKHIYKSMQIEHVGSTAIPGLGGKGIIDIAIAVRSDDTSALTTELQVLGYEFRPNHSSPDRLFFRIDLPDDEEGTRRYHVHLMRQGNREWQDMLTFRDYLKNHPEAMQEYADLKKKSANIVEEDGKKYRDLKDPFFKKILNKK